MKAEPFSVVIHPVVATLFVMSYLRLLTIEIGCFDFRRVTDFFSEFKVLTSVLVAEFSFKTLFYSLDIVLRP